MALTFRKADKRKSKLRLALCGPAGSGKTYTMLAVGSELCKLQGGRMAVVDTEHGSASKYADLFDFDVIELETFDPLILIEAIEEAGRAGYSVVGVDSLSHFWAGKGGELEMVDNAAKRSQSGNSFTAWKTVTPVHNRLIDTIISAPLHVIATLRTKTEWVIEENDRGKKVPRKVGLAPVMRDGIEYEFDLCGDMDIENSFSVTKSRCPALSGQVIQKPGAAMARTLAAWLDAGVEAPTSAPAAGAPEVVTVPVQAAALQGPTPLKPADKKAFDFKKMLDAFAAIRAEIGDEAYYRVLGIEGYEHANQIKSANKAREIYRALEDCRKAQREWKAEQERKEAPRAAPEAAPVFQATDDDLPDILRADEELPARLRGVV